MHSAYSTRENPFNIPVLDENSDVRVHSYTHLFVYEHMELLGWILISKSDSEESGKFWLSWFG